MPQEGWHRQRVPSPPRQQPAKCERGDALLAFQTPTLHRVLEHNWTSRHCSRPRGSDLPVEGEFLLQGLEPTGRLSSLSLHFTCQPLSSGESCSGCEPGASGRWSAGGDELISYYTEWDTECEHTAPPAQC